MTTTMKEASTMKEALKATLNDETRSGKKLLTVRGLHVEYITDDARVYAVNGFDLEAERGETIGLVGETGAGKTTTALSIMRLLPEKIGRVTKGEIMLDGIDILKSSEGVMRTLRGDLVSMIFQDPMTSLNPVLTVGDQIAEVLQFHKKYVGKEGIDKRVDEILTLVGLPPQRKKEYPHQFSGGMRQRVVIAMALACEPRLLIADEPTTALDVTIQAQVLEMMRELQEKLRTTVILITHDLGVVAQNCDRVVIMYAGENIEEGTVKRVFDGTCRHPYTDGLFGSIPDLKKKMRRLNPIDGLMPDPTELPSGCRFYSRCPLREDICGTTHPAPVVKDGHMIRCHLRNGSER